MLSSIIDAFKVPELRKKILFTLAILALYRFGAYVPVPGIPFNEFANQFTQSGGVSMTMLDLFTGGALSNFSVFSLGIMPYITASIIMQLMPVSYTHLDVYKRQCHARVPRVQAAHACEPQARRGRQADPRLQEVRQRH